MNRINPEKLLLSKWTDRNPQNREKHFIVIDLLRDHEETIIACELEAVLSRRRMRIDWQVLRNNERWQFGWK